MATPVQRVAGDLGCWLLQTGLVGLAFDLAGVNSGRWWMGLSAAALVLAIRFEPVRVWLVAQRDAADARPSSAVPEQE